MLGLKDMDFPSSEMEAINFKNIRQYFGNLTISEINFAFELAINRVFEVDLNHYQLINPEYISRILKAYIAYKPKLNKDLKAMAPKQETEPSEEEQQKIIEEGLVTVFEKYKKDPVIEKCYAWVYDQLQNKINLTPERKRAFRDQAKEILKSEKYSEKVKEEGPKIADITQSIENLKEDKNIEVINLAKRLAVKEYFDHLIEFDFNLTDK